MKILVLNAGSSSIKYQLFDMPGENPIAMGAIDRIGESESAVKLQVMLDSDAPKQFEDKVTIENHHRALEQIVSLLLDKKLGAIASSDEIKAVGHRVVHGGERFSKPAIIDAELLSELKKLSFLAPLHNPANIEGIEVATTIFSHALQVAVFDTAFHQTMPEHAFRYAIPNSLYQDHHLRAYGFHGTSHQYVVRAAANLLQIPLQDFNAITIHLGNGCSMAAIQEGKCIDTSMGLTPLGGLMMGTRSGDIDPSIPLFLGQHLGMSFAEIDKLLNKQSGLKGVAGENDVRKVLALAQGNDINASLAIDIYVYRIRKYIGAYAVALRRLDAIIFTAGVGENSAYIRSRVCGDLQLLGVQMDTARNEAVDNENPEFHAHDSKVSLLAIPTNEELEIAMQVHELLH